MLACTDIHVPVHQCMYVLYECMYACMYASMHTYMLYAYHLCRHIIYVGRNMQMHMHVCSMNACMYVTCKELGDPRPFTARKYCKYKYFRQYCMEYSSI